jgi:N-acetylglucosamine-6-phosphate deacetylase
LNTNLLEEQVNGTEKTNFNNAMRTAECYTMLENTLEVGVRSELPAVVIDHLLGVAVIGSHHADVAALLAGVEDLADGLVCKV